MDRELTPNPPFLPFAQPDLDESELDEVIECLTSGWITTGPKVKRFEAQFAEYVGARHAVAVNSATAAMHLSLEAIGLRPGDLVFVPAYTFTATAEVVRYFDAVPVLVDSDADDLNMSPDHLARALALARDGRLVLGDDRYPIRDGERRARAVIPVHMAGQPVRMEEVYALAAGHNLSVIEDAAHALPSCHHGRIIGATPADWYGAGQEATTTPALPAHATCFSFYATKTLTTGEGGMITTDDEALAERCRVMSLHGISRDAWKRYTAEGSWHYEVVAPGFKYNLTDIAAALGLAQLAKVQRMWARRCAIAEAYTQAFRELAEYVETPSARDDVQHAWHLYVLRLNVATSETLLAEGDLPGSGAPLRITRAEFINQLRARGIGASVHFIPLHLHPYYRDTYGYQANDFPTAFREYQRAVSLPIYSRMSDGDVQRVIETVTDIVLEHRA